MSDRICIVVSSSMTINAFLLEPIAKLSQVYDVHIIVNDEPENISCPNNVTVLTVPIERKISPLTDLLALYKLVRIFKKYSFKSVHSVTPKAGLLSMLASFLSARKFRIHTFTGQVWATRRGPGRWLLKQIDRVISALATDVLVDSSSQRQFLLDEHVVSARKSSVLASGSISGVDTSRFKPDEQAKLKTRQEFNIAIDDPVFLFIGRLNRDKGVLDLARAFAQLGDSSARLIMVGPDEAGIQVEMEQLMENCLDRVYFTGFSKVPEQYMAAADVLCLPSYREGFGSVVIEAAAAGITAIGSRIYGVEDAILDGVTGLLFEPGNSDELFAHMEAVIADKELMRRLGNQARKRALELFSSETLASAWLDFYQVRL